MRVFPKRVATDEERCHYEVFVPEQMRYTGRVRGGFERHYVKRRCARKAVVYGGFCKQHETMK